MRARRDVAGDSGSRRETLVGGDVLDEPEQLGRERRLRERLDPVAGNAGRHLDHVVVGEPGKRPVVADVDLVHRAVAAKSDATSPTAASL